MIGDGYTISYLNYAVILWIISGLLILFIDVKEFKLAGMNKEHKLSRFIGWFNLVLGFVLVIAELLLL